MKSSSQPGANTSARKPAALAVRAWCDDERIYVALTDGRVESAPLTPRLRQATPKQRRACRIEDFGTAIRWEEIDEDVGVDYVIGVTEDEMAEVAGFKKGMPEE